MEFTTQAIIGGGILVLLIFLWLLWKIAFRLVKYFFLMLLLAAVAAGAAWYRMQPPPANPSIGKHAYLKETGSYLGVVEGEGDDKQRGEVWAIRPPGGYPKMYGKSRVLLKIEREAEPKNAPTPNQSPNVKTSPKQKS